MKRIHAKSCCSKKIEDKNVVKDFLNENHKESCCDYLLAYGLYYINELIQLMIFDKAKIDKLYSWEILRDCTKKDFNIQEGIYKLWVKFKEENAVHSCLFNLKNINNLKDYLKYCDFKPLKVNNKVETISIYSYFPFGIVYKITDLDTGKFYIGKCEVEEKWKNGYPGSGGEWKSYYNKYKGIHKFKREILKDNFKSPRELYEYEIQEIRKYCIKLPNGNYKVDESTGCMNRKTTLQSEMSICPDCNSILFHQIKNCSQYKSPEQCKECGKKYGHKKTCSQYKEKSSCVECGGRNGQHYSICSKYKKRICPECGCNSGHLANCSKSKKIKCRECGSYTIHKPGCSKYKKPTKCIECGSINSHKKYCSHYNPRTIVCSECGGKDGKHKDFCSRSKGKCPECGYSLQSRRHSKDCSKYKEPKKAKICEECGSSIRAHKKTCSKYKQRKSCLLCGGLAGNHKKDCLKYKRSYNG